MFILRNGIIKRGTFGGSLASAQSTASYSVTGHDYQTSRQMYEYLPVGYDQAASASLPLMIWGHGDGVRANWANVNSLGEGIGYYLNNGSWNDLTYNHVVVIPQLTVGDVDYTTTDFDDVLTKLASEGIKIDANRICVAGFSRGSIGLVDGCWVNRSSQVASAINVSGPNTTSGWVARAGSSGAGYMQIHGTSDGTFGNTIGGTLYWANGGFSAWNDLTPAPRGMYFYPLGHESNLWDGHAFNPASAEVNIFEFASKFNKISGSQATQFVSNAETTLSQVDYKESVSLVGLLTPGAEKTALQSRLATLLTTINKTNGVRYYVSPQTSGLGALNTGYNIWTSFATGNGITNIVDVDNGASTIDVTMTQECATSSRDGSASGNNAGRQRSHGFDDYRINLQGFVVNNAVNNGVVTIGGIPTGKLVDIFIYHHHLAANDDSTSFSQNNRLRAVCNSITVDQYSAYNNHSHISFTDVPETSGNITIALEAIDSRDCLVTGLEFVVHD